MVEDYTGKTDMVLFGDDYVRFQNYMLLGSAVLICGCFKQRMYKNEFEFKITSITLAENIKRQLTKQLQLGLDVRVVQKEMVDFLEENLKKYPGSSTLKVVVTEPKNDWKIDLITINNGIEVNHELVAFLEDKPEIEVQVGLA
jgi:DNA polymerase-3 subunit alpha